MGRGYFGGGDTREPLTTPFPQALPYVALLIAMIFFIYAVIGMQVRDTRVCEGCTCVRAGVPRHAQLCITPSSPTDLWEGGPAGWNPDQP